MRKGLVIADDLTGAAEIAGIAHRFGLKTRIVRDGAMDLSTDITVVDTDTRSSKPEAARQELRRQLAPFPLDSTDFLFKKTDSALRGPVRAELETVLELSGKIAALLLPNNPSRGRTISEDGIYRIDGIPLHETSFAIDPQWPARSSSAAELIGDPYSLRVGIAKAQTAEDVARYAGGLAPSILPAGGADFFEAILRQRGLIPKSITPSPLAAPSLFVCGTTAPTAQELTARATAIGIPISSIFEGDLPPASPCTLLSINRPVDPSPQIAEQLQSRMANLVAALLKANSISTLFIDGGATAAAICRKMNWHTFDVVHELSPGVVTLQIVGHTAPVITIKPGSYRWPEEVLEHRFSVSNGITQ